MRHLVLIALCAAAGCATRAPIARAVELRVEPAGVQAGDSLTLVLRNNSDASIGYNLCASGLERRDGESWTAVPSDRVCTMELRVLPSGQETRYTVALPADLRPGDYRAVTGVHPLPSGEPTGVASEAFAVTARQ